MDTRNENEIYYSPSLEIEKHRYKTWPLYFSRWQPGGLRILHFL